MQEYSCTSSVLAMASGQHCLARYSQKMNLQVMDWFLFNALKRLLYGNLIGTSATFLRSRIWRRAHECLLHATLVKELYESFVLYYRKLSELFVLNLTAK